MENLFLPQKINLQRSGLSQYMGEVESRILELIWIHCGNSGVTAREMRQYLEHCYKKLSFNAVMTIMNRMVKKNILIKNKSLGQYLYLPVLDRDVFIRQIREYVVDKLDELKLYK